MTTHPEPDRVQFDVLLRAAGSGEVATVENVAAFRPDPGVVERCRRALAAAGVTCHATGFGLACEAAPEVFEAVFQVSLRRELGAPPGAPPWSCEPAPTPPEALAPHVDQITFSGAPEAF